MAKSLSLCGFGYRNLPVAFAFLVEILLEKTSSQFDKKITLWYTLRDKNKRGGWTL